ncbi:MAG: anaerobic ribonucleoside-triphosphate reductase activating protein [Candidatus Pacearchaeota archaeon]
MKICGLQKTTLIDFPGKIACTIFLSNCNFRCGFCYNADLVFDKLEFFTEEYILDFLDKRKDKLEGVCISGGEPLLTLEKDFVKKIKEMGYLIKIDTNGSFPEKLNQLILDGSVDYVAMDIKNSREKYNLTCGVNIDLKKIEKSIKIISSLENYEFRTTIVSDLHNNEDIKKIGEWLFSLINKKPKNYFLQGFKHDGVFIDEKYSSFFDTKLSDLELMKKVALPYFESVNIRV